VDWVSYIAFAVIILVFSVMFTLSEAEQAAMLQDSSDKSKSYIEMLSFFKGMVEHDNSMIAVSDLIMILAEDVDDESIISELREIMAKDELFKSTKSGCGGLTVNGMLIMPKGCVWKSTESKAKFYLTALEGEMRVVVEYYYYKK